MSYSDPSSMPQHANGGLACPWCGARMKLRDIPPPEHRPPNALVCERHPADHTIRLDREWSRAWRAL